MLRALAAVCMTLVALVAVTLAVRGADAPEPPTQAAALPPLAQRALQALRPPPPPPPPGALRGPDRPPPPPGAECFRSSPSGPCIPVCAREAEASSDPLPPCGDEPPPVRYVPLRR